jgi:FAD/FMN-containing dehydrogenase
LSSEAIVSVDLVDASGRPRHVTVDEDPELFWALRGGGGDFGVVTALEVRLFPADHLVGGRMFWPIEQMPSVLRAFREATATAPPELSLWYYTYRFPPLPEVPEPMRGKSFSAVAAAALGPGQPGSAELARLRAVPGLVADTTAPMPLSLLGNIVAEPIDPTPAMVHSMLLDDLDDGLIENLTSAVGADSGSPLAAVQIRHLGAALARSGPNPGAGGTVDSPYVLFALGVVAMPALVEPITATFARIDEAVAGHTDGRTVPNLLAVGDDIGRAWPAEVRRRLAEIKARVDPHGTIVSNHPVGAPSDGWQGRVEVGDGRSTYG